MQGYVKFKFLNWREIVYFILFYFFLLLTSKEANGLEWVKDPTTPISRLVHESRDRGHWWMRNQTGKCNFSRYQPLNFHFRRNLAIWKSPDKAERGCSAHRSTAKCENYCSCASLIYYLFSFLFFLFLSCLQVLNKRFTKKLWKLGMK